jgi:protoporphyrinogen oxidase
MSAFVDFAGTPIERYYHFICRPDLTTFHYLREFGLMDRLRWVETKMGFYYNGTLHDWGHPFALMRFPGLGLIDKARYALHVMRAKGIRNWKPTTRCRPPSGWSVGSDGVPTMCFEAVPLQVYSIRINSRRPGSVPASRGWRYRRVSSRRARLSGGGRSALEAVTERFDRSAAALPSRRRGGGAIRGEGVDRRVTGLRVGEAHAFDQVISTIPLPYPSV